MVFLSTSRSCGLSQTGSNFCLRKVLVGVGVSFINGFGTVTCRRCVNVPLPAWRSRDLRVWQVGVWYGLCCSLAELPDRIT